MYCRFMSLTEKLGIPCRYFWYTQKKLYIFCRVQIISVGIFLTHRKIMRKITTPKFAASPNIQRKRKPKRIQSSAKRKKKRPTARTWSTVRCICLASKKQVQCSPVGGGQLVPALISIDSIPAEFQMNPGRRGLQIRNSHGLCFSVAVEPQSQQMFYSGRVCLFRFQKVF